MKKLTNEQFIEKAKNVHGNKYDYSKVNYANSQTKVCIICPTHGEFLQTPHDHLNGHGCERCYNEIRGNTLKSNIKTFIEKAKNVHGNKYDYSKVEYINDRTKVCIICPTHGEFLQIPRDHLNGHGCKKCGITKTVLAKTKKYEFFLEKALQIHNKKYFYDKTTYINRTSKMKILCPIHGEFWQTPHNHLQGQGCPYCKDSILEKELENILCKNNIKYINKCTSSKLKWLEKQHLDFYLPEYNIAIECQGIQHFEPRDKFGGNKCFIETIKRDKIKNEKCKKNGVILLYYSSEYLKRKFNEEMLTKNNILKHIKNERI